ncbi:MAG: hypothetical protein ICV56_04150 [Nitrososphaeraceae archaeon]|jgi:hypothetical protein|nr:hypothetical protein [Nitrososphaeraceae archaeon]HEX2068209.1 DUF6766 family protein [Nitrososphaeraceae archaeon]
MRGKIKYYGYFWVTLGLFIMSISLHWTFAWYSYIQEQIAHKQPIEFTDYFNQTFRDTMENWQSEFLQLIWQVAGLSILWYVGSAQSKEANDRLEEKVDLLIQKLDTENGKKLIQELDKKYPRKP